MSCGDLDHVRRGRLLMLHDEAAPEIAIAFGLVGEKNVSRVVGLDERGDHNHLPLGLEAVGVEIGKDNDRVCSKGGCVLLEVAEDHGNDAGARLRQNGGRRNGLARVGIESATIGMSHRHHPRCRIAAAAPGLRLALRRAARVGRRKISGPGLPEHNAPQALRCDDNRTPGIDTPDVAHGRSPNASATSSAMSRISGRSPTTPSSMAVHCGQATATISAPALRASAMRMSGILRLPGMSVSAAPPPPPQHLLLSPERSISLTSSPSLRRRSRGASVSPLYRAR